MREAPYKLFWRDGQERMCYETENKSYIRDRHTLTYNSLQVLIIM